jgi:hypothetical protein
MAAGENPPDGAIIDYNLKQPVTGVLTLEIHDASGALVRRYRSDDPPPAPIVNPTWPKYWDRPFAPLSTASGAQRFVWDLHYAPVAGMTTELDDSEAVPHDTPRIPTSPWVLPGNYTVRLLVNGKTLTQPLVVRMDPRVKTTPAAWAEQFRVSKQLYDDEQKVGRGTLQTEMAALQRAIQNSDIPPTAAQTAAAAKFHMQAGGQP